MIKKLLFVPVLFLTACSSSELKTEASGGAAPTVLRPVETQAAEKSVPEIKREEKVSSAQYSPLAEAIRQQNDELIQKSAGEILTQNSKDLTALNALAMVNYKKSRLEAAEYLLNKAIAAHSDSSEAYSNMGLVLLAQGERREATRAFRKAIELSPTNAVAGANVGAMYIQDRDFSKAVLALEIAVKNGLRSDPKVMNNYAIALSATGHAKDAAEVYDKLLKDNPSQKDVMLNYSILLIEELKKYREGLDLLNRLKFVGSAAETRQIIKDLENKAKAGLQ